MIPDEWRERVRMDWLPAKVHGASERIFITIWSARLCEELGIPQGSQRHEELKREIETLLEEAQGDE